MNEEEKQAFEILKGLEFYEYEWYVRTDILVGHANETVERVRKAIEIIVSLINKQQKQKEKLKKELRQERTMNIEALNTLKECIHKDKIKDLIKEKAKTDTYNFKTIAVKDIEELLA